MLITLFTFFKEFLVIATPLSYLNGIAFYVVRLIVYVLYSTCVLLVAGRYNALGIIPAFLAFLLVFLFILAIMSYAFLISVFFNAGELYFIYCFELNANK